MKNDNQDKASNSDRNIYLLGLLAILACAYSNSCKGSVSEKSDHEQITISIEEESRPIAIAMMILENKYGRIITYEDAPYEHKLDIKDVTTLVRRDLNKWDQENIPRNLIPRPANLEVTIKLTRSNGKLEDIEEVVRRILDANAKNENPGRFTYKKDGEVFHVIPEKIRTSTGRILEIDSILDTRITISEKQRSLDDILNEICKSLKQITGEDIGLGAYPVRILSQKYKTLSAKEEEARNVLMRTLSLEDFMLSWHLNFNPGATGSGLRFYSLDIHLISQGIGSPN